MISIAWPVLLSAEPMNTLTSSGYAMAAPKEEFFSTLRYWLVIGGIITRSACGMTTRRRICARPQADRRRRLELALRHRQDAAAHDLGDEGGGVGRERGEQRDEFRHQHEAAADIEAAERRHVP